jgi:hypothetical protein
MKRNLTLQCSYSFKESTGKVPQIDHQFVFGTSVLLPMALRSPDLTQTDFFLWGFVKENVYVPRCRQHYTSSGHGSERPVQTLIRKFSTTCGRRLNIDLMLLEPLVALTLNFINDKLLFIKLLIRFSVGTCFVSVT